MPDLDALRSRLLKGPPAWTSFAATSAQPLLLADDPGAAIEHAELAVKPLTEGSWRWTLDVAVVLGVEAARRLGDASTLDRWIALAMNGVPAPTESRERQARHSHPRAGSVNQIRAARNERGWFDASSRTIPCRPPLSARRRCDVP